MPLADRAGRSRKKSGFIWQSCNGLGRNTREEPEALLKLPAEGGACSDDGKVRNDRAPKNDHSSSDETISSNLDWSTILLTQVDVDAVRQDLRTVSRHQRKLSHSHRVGAVHQVTASDCSVRPKRQRRGANDSGKKISALARECSKPI